MKTGIPLEIFKFLGSLTCIYLACHYYTALSDFLRQFIPGDPIPLAFMDFLSFLLLVIIGYIVFILLREIFRHLIMKAGSDNVLFKWLGLGLGLVRGYLTASLVVFAMVISTTSYLKNSVEHSYSGKKLFEVCPSVYSWTWNNIASKVMVGEKYNATIDEVKEGFNTP
jgi:uncharacterized membrane protein required for colicin V production